MTKSDALKPRRQLGLFDAIMIVMGGIVGAGIFANPSEVAHRVHTPFLILGVWVLGGVFAMCGAFIWAELATRLPAANGRPICLSSRGISSFGGVCVWMGTASRDADRRYGRGSGYFLILLSRAYGSRLE